MQMLTSLNTNVPAAAPKAPAAANTSARPAEESWVTDDGVSLSSADVAGGKANVPANGMHVTYKYDHGAMRDIKMGAICGFVGGLVLPGIIVPLMGFAASPVTAPIGLVLGAYAGAVTDHNTEIEGTLKQTAQGVIFEPTDANRFGIVNVQQHANTPVAESNEAWYLN